MKPLTPNPMERQALSIEALCLDIFDPKGRQSMLRLNALRSVVKSKEANSGD
jgi:hypothetical protein